jgi:LysM repeat protein
MKKLLTIALSVALLASSLPVAAAPYTVKRGDTLFGIAKRSGTTVAQIAAANDIADPDLILAGQVLEIDASLGANLPIVVADFDDSLASRITSSASSLTLTRGTVPGTGTALSGLYGFRIDDEYMTATCVSTACTIVARGLSPVDGSTEVSALKAEHRRGAVVKISNFPQLALITRMLNGQDSIPGNIYSSSTTYIPPSAAYFASKYYVDSVGAGGFTAANVSSTGGLTAISSGIPNCSTAAACAIVNVSSTGGLYRNPTTGEMAFGGVVNTSTVFNGTASFIGNATATARFALVNAPTTTFDVVNMGALGNLVATGTAGTTITAGSLLVLSSTSSRLFLADSSVSTTAWAYVGVALSAATAGNSVSFARHGAIVGGFSGLSPGSKYYLSTGGAIALSPGTIPVSVGIAYSTSTMLLRKPEFRAVTAGTSANVCNGDQAITVPFTPTRIELEGGNTNSLGASIGTWTALSSGASTSRAIGGSIGATSYFVHSGTSALYWAESGPTTFSVAVVTSTSGFNLICTQSGSARTVNWTAFYDEQ